ncbi:glyoxalase [Actinophytocola xinjiangensis]|uniref:Glyoxalase n=1 Tax=Actinophytocola xinjiangensis TaxID=485602 RepID=A0A7Z1AVV2_9PSEU|nr:VOC family protein [Actinophytocola xinjiangensis]OLF06846.1 glyoxalase [Actinophytocola xinjiangensis]
MLTVGSVVLGVSDLPRAQRFWTQALDYVPRDTPEPDWVVLRPRTGAGPNISLGTSETPVQPRPRVHLDLYTTTPEAEIDRLLGLGATQVNWPDYPPDADFTVLADPEGNRFCVIDTR